MSGGRIVLVTGSRVFDGHPRAEAWCYRLLMLSLARESVVAVVHGGVKGPDAYADHVARMIGLRRVVFAPDGRIYDTARPRAVERWASEELRRTLSMKEYFKFRNRAMVARVAERGEVKECLAFKAPWATTEGTDFTVGVAREAGFLVTLHTADASLREAA